MIGRIVLFLILNFAALGIGGMFTGDGVPSDWYTELNKAPWTPPGWVFGAAWTTIMICFSFYMSYAMKAAKKIRLLIGLYSIQWVLNVFWNPAFFYFHNVFGGLIIITALTLLIGFILIKYWNALRAKSILLLPYLIWLCIATSLNAYIYLNN